MSYLKLHYNNIIKKELISKYYIKNINNIPKIKNLILNIGISDINNNKFLILPTFLVLELITNKKIKPTISKKNNINLKIKKNLIVGCKIILKKNQIYTFLEKLILFVLPNIKNFKKYSKKNINKNSISITIKDILLFPELEKYFNFFYKVNKLNIIIMTSTEKKMENILLLSSLKIPITN